MQSQSGFLTGFALICVMAIAACTVAPPAGPSITALPGPGKSLDRFNLDDNNCRGYAASRTQNAPQQAQAASNNANGTAVAGTLIGAGLGAALGSLSGNVGEGAAIGAGAGLLGGASAAGSQAQGAADSLQQQYDSAYAQCMVGNSEAIESNPSPGYAAGPSQYNTALPAAIATGAAAAIILSNRPDHDDDHYDPNHFYPNQHPNRPDSRSPAAAEPTRADSHPHDSATHDAAAGNTKKKDSKKKPSS